MSPAQRPEIRDTGAASCRTGDRPSEESRAALCRRQKQQPEAMVRADKELGIAGRGLAESGAQSG
jgi:hypothetical protein